jgi:hypothetical protein
MIAVAGGGTGIETTNLLGPGDIYEFRTQHVQNRTRVMV